MYYQGFLSLPFRDMRSADFEPLDRFSCGIAHGRSGLSQTNQGERTHRRHTLVSDFSA